MIVNPPFSLHKNSLIAQNTVVNSKKGAIYIMKATGIVRRIDDLGRVVIPKEIRRVLRIREGDPLLTTLTLSEKQYIFTRNFESFAERIQSSAPKRTDVI